MKNWSRPKGWCGAAALAVLIGLGAQPCARAQQGEAPPASKGENFSAKPPAQLFASDCTGAGCHKSPQGLAKNQGFGLASFLREHYTNSRESAAAMAAYLSKLPGAPEPKEARKPKGGKLPPSSPAGGPGWFESAPTEAAAPAKPAPKDERAARHPNSRTSRTAARPEEAAPGASPRHDLEPGGETAKPAPRERGPRNRPAAAGAAAAAPGAEPAVPAAARPEAPAEPAAAVAPVEAAPAAAPASAAPAPAAASAGPPKKQYDIFD